MDIETRAWDLQVDLSRFRAETEINGWREYLNEQTVIIKSAMQAVRDETIEECANSLDNFAPTNSLFEARFKQAVSLIIAKDHILALKERK